MHHRRPDRGHADEITGDVTSLVSGRLADRIGARLPVALGLALQAVGCFLLYLTEVSTTYSGLWLPTLVAGVGVGMTFSTPSAAGLPAVPPDESGEASGIINIFRYLGASLVVAVGSLAFTSSRARRARSAPKPISFRA